MPQTREHLLLARQVGIKKLVVFVNKVIPEPQRRSDKYPVLFHTEQFVRLLRHMNALGTYRGKHVISVSILHKAMSLPTRSSNKTTLMGSVRVLR